MKLAIDAQKSVDLPDLSFSSGHEGRAMSVREIIEGLSPVVCAVAGALVGDKRVGEELAVEAFAESHNQICQGDIYTARPIVLKSIVRKGEKYDALRRPLRLLMRRLGGIVHVGEVSDLNRTIRSRLLMLKFTLRATLVLREIAELSIEAVGEIMDARADEVRGRLLSARKALLRDMGNG